MGQTRTRVESKLVSFVEEVSFGEVEAGVR